MLMKLMLHRYLGETDKAKQVFLENLFTSELEKIGCKAIVADESLTTQDETIIRKITIVQTKNLSDPNRTSKEDQPLETETPRAGRRQPRGPTPRAGQPPRPHKPGPGEGHQPRLGKGF